MGFPTHSSGPETAGPELGTGVKVIVADLVRLIMPFADPCPRCESTDVWIEEEAMWIEFGCESCNYFWKREKGS